MVNLYLICSLLMAALFIISTSAQFNDPDWYLWIPLYAGAAYVNLMNLIGTGSSKITTNVGKIILFSGEFLLSKVISEHYSGESVSVGILSMNMRERVVREKIGSALVILCMILQVSISTEFQKDPAKKIKMDVASLTKYGMAILVCIGYGLSAVFLMYHENEISSDQYNKNCRLAAESETTSTMDPTFVEVLRETRIAGLQPTLGQLT